MSFKTTLHPLQSPCNRSSAGIESHKVTIQLLVNYSERGSVFENYRGSENCLAGSKLCSVLDNLCVIVFKVGWKVWRLPCLSSFKRQHVKPKMEALQWSVKENSVKLHIFSIWD